MRTLIVVVLLSIATSAEAQLRIWTIARDVESVEADLLAVRGDTAYLKIGDKVESIPLERLSAADQEYIASLALRPVSPGTQDTAADAASFGGPVIPNPSGQLPGVERSLVVPASGRVPAGTSEIETAAAEEALPHPPGQAPLPAQQSTARSYDNTWPGAAAASNAQQRGRADANSTDRRAQRRPTQQQQNNRATNSNRSDDDEPRGLFRGRRRQR